MGKTDNSYTAVQMEEKKSKEEREHDLEEPFNEEFWLKVRHLLYLYDQHACLVLVGCFDSQNVTFQSFSSIFLPPSRLYFRLNFKSLVLEMPKGTTFCRLDVMNFQSKHFLYV